MHRTLDRARSDRGANLVEYTLLIALVVLVCLAAVTEMGRKVPADGFDSISSRI
ncbi:MAG: hypothetical protein R2698_12545 [Microthrixaceae bacterium]